MQQDPSLAHASPWILAAALLAAAAPAGAGTIQINGGELVNAQHVVTFDSAAANVPAGTQFIADGLTFKTLSGNGLPIVNEKSCLNGMSGNYLYIGVTANCSSFSPLSDGVSIEFAAPVTELSWTGFSIAWASGFQLQALRDGALVSTLTLNDKNTFTKGTVRVSGGDFDELRITENGAYGGAFALDNFRWNNAAVAAVPEPGSLMLAGLGVMQLVRLRRRRA